MRHWSRQEMARLAYSSIRGCQACASLGSCSRHPNRRVKRIVGERRRRRHRRRYCNGAIPLSMTTPAMRGIPVYLLSDVYARVGGVHRDASTDVMIRLHSGNVYGDNLWLWRADHVQLRPKEEPNFPQISSKYRQTERGECEVKNGLVVEAGASNVTIVGLAVEHATEDQTVWNGEYGQVYFYQSEFPYDVDHSFADNKFAGYRVGPNVQNHKAVGLGIYSNFRDYDVEVGTAVVHPAEDIGSRGIQLRNIFTVKLDNKGKISSIVNGRGPGPTVDSKNGHPYRCLNETCLGSEGE
mmetsp:Transcript_25388/g.45823  ORF Transcript_25388/g.45823 Transcript_25388/m.45823 type:complete len:296 (-) Transcript_25388:275-1162(-)